MKNVKKRHSQLELYTSRNHTEAKLSSMGLTKTGKAIRELGSDLRKGKRKIKRPVDPRKPLHIVLRATRARGEFSMLDKKNKNWIQNKLNELATKYQIKVERFANVGNHLHLLIRMKTVAQFQGFLRQFTGAIAFKIMKAKKGEPKGRFWDHLAYTRIVEWGREFKKVTNYLLFNTLEGMNRLRRWGRAPSEGWTLICDPPPLVG